MTSAASCGVRSGRADCSIRWASRKATVRPGRTTCFCEFCQKKGRENGIDVERARRGFDEMEMFTRNCHAGQRPRDGYFSAFWRLLLKYPEVLAWENLWAESRHELQASIYRKVKGINPALQVGWHFWQNVSFSPFQRAEENLADLSPASPISSVLHIQQRWRWKICDFCQRRERDCFRRSLLRKMPFDLPLNSWITTKHLLINWRRSGIFRGLCGAGDASCRHGCGWTSRYKSGRAWTLMCQ